MLYIWAKVIQAYKSHVRLVKLKKLLITYLCKKHFLHQDQIILDNALYYAEMQVFLLMFFDN